MVKRADVQNRPAPRRLKRKVPSYTEQEKIAVVTILLEHGGMTVEAIDYARQLTNSNLSTNTLYKWLAAYKDKVIAANSALMAKPPDITSVVESTRNTLLERMSRILDKSLDRAEETVGEAGYRDVMVGSGIAIDKIRVVASITPDVEAVLKRMAAACKEHNTTLIDYLTDCLDALNSAPITLDIHANSDGE